MNKMPKRTLQEINQDLLHIYANMGEAWEILRGFERGEIPIKDAKRRSKLGAHYLSQGREALEQIRKEIRSFSN